MLGKLLKGVYKEKVYQIMEMRSPNYCWINRFEVVFRNISVLIPYIYISIILLFHPFALLASMALWQLKAQCH